MTPLLGCLLAFGAYAPASPEAPGAAPAAVIVATSRGEQVIPVRLERLR